MWIPIRLYLFSFHVVHISLRPCSFTPSTAASTRTTIHSLNSLNSLIRRRLDGFRCGYDVVYCSKVDSVVNRLAVGSVHKIGTRSLSRILSFLFSTQLFFFDGARCAQCESDIEIVERMNERTRQKKKTKNENEWTVKTQSEQKWMDIIFRLIAQFLRSGVIWRYDTDDPFVFLLTFVFGSIHWKS